jgi:glycosyltransferase involved in cell wall biosynthesis
LNLQEEFLKENFRIAILHSAFIESGGAERVVLDQLQSLYLKGYKIDCYGAVVNYKKCFPDRISQLPIKPYLINLDISKFSYSTLLPLTILFSDFIKKKLKEYDVLLCHHQPAPWLAYKTWVNYRVPYACYIHHPPRFLYPRLVEQELGWGHDPDRKVIEFFGKRLSFFKKVDLSSILNAKKVFVNSKRTLREVEKIYGVKPVLCYPAVETFLTKQYSTSAFFEEKIFSSKFKPPVILTTGRHTPHKRLDWLLLIFKKILKELDATLVVVGSFHSTYTTKIKSMASKLQIQDKTVFTGRVSEDKLIDYYLNSSVYVYPSPNEDFGLGPVEAMGFGLPVVVWGDSSGPDETVVDGVTGFKAEPYNLEDFAQKTIKILVDEKLRRKMAKNALNHVKTNFSLERHIETLIKNLVL